MAADERRREFDTLRTQGATRGSIFAIIMGESLVIASAGGCIGVVLTSLILGLYQGMLSAATQVTIAVPAPVPLLSGALFALLVTAAIGGAASLYPAYIHASQNP